MHFLEVVARPCKWNILHWVFTRYVNTRGSLTLQLQTPSETVLGAVFWRLNTWEGIWSTGVSVFRLGIRRSPAMLKFARRRWSKRSCFCDSVLYSAPTLGIYNGIWYIMVMGISDGNIQFRTPVWWDSYGILTSGFLTLKSRMGFLNSQI